MPNRNKRPILNWRNGLFFLLGLGLATGLQLLYFPRKHDSSPHPGPNQKSLPPWAGELEYTTFKLLPPDEALSNPDMSKALDQTSTLLMKLRITPQSDLEALIRYWGQGTRGRAMRPFLESLVRVPEGEAVNITYFLPAIARMRLYTFPDISKSRWSGEQDCLWTGMNFFNDVLDDKFTNVHQVELKLATDYVQVNTNYAFGDLIVLRTADHQIRHMCVHIADNIVFTKSPIGRHGPWVLTPLSEMLTQFPSQTPLQTVIYRRKEL